MAKPIGPYDLYLQDIATSPTTIVGLTLAVDESGRKQWRELRIPPLPPRQSQGAVSWTHKDPLQDYVWAQDDWSGGALDVYWSPNRLNTYTAARRVDPRWNGVLALGPVMRATSICVPDFSSEQGSIWSAGTNVTLTNGGTASGASSFTVNSTGTDDGVRAFKATCPSAGSISAGAVIAQVALANPTLYRGLAIKVTGHLRRTTGSQSGIQLRIIDSVGNGTASSSATSSTYSDFQAIRTIDALATSVNVQVICDTDITGLNSHVFEFDRILITLPWDSTVVAGFAVYTDGAIYTAIDRFIFKFNATNFVWDLVYVAADTDSEASAIVAFKGNIYVAFGLSAPYVYGADTTWTVSNRGGTDEVAKYLAVVRDEFWKTETDATNASVSTNPANAGVAFTDYTLGQSGASTTGLYAYGDSVVATKQDGIYAFLRTYVDGAAANLFQNITPGYANMRSSENFRAGAEWNGWLWLATSQAGLIRYNGSVVENLSNLLVSPRARGVSLNTKVGYGHVRGFGAEPAQLWVATAAPLSTNLAYHQLISVRQQQDGSLTPHLIDTIRARNVYVVGAVANSAYGANGYGFVFAGADMIATGSDVGIVIQFWDTPATSPAPWSDGTPRMALTGHLNTVTWHGGFPDTPKAFISLVLWLEDCDANNTVAVTYGLNNEDATVNSLGTYNTSGIVTKFFAEGTNGRAIQLQFAFTQAATSGPSPKVYAMALHTMLRPSRVRVWEATVRMDGQELLESGYFDATSMTTKLANLSTLEQQTYPIVMRMDFNGDGTQETVYGHIIDLQELDEDSARRLVGPSGGFVKLTIQEVVVA